jgi:hypothetical protein
MWRRMNVLAKISKISTKICGILYCLVEPHNLSLLASRRLI